MQIQGAGEVGGIKTQISYISGSPQNFKISLQRVTRQLPKLFYQNQILNISRIFTTNTGSCGGDKQIISVTRLKMPESNDGEDLDLLLSLQERVLETPPDSAPSSPSHSPGILSSLQLADELLKIAKWIIPQISGGHRKTKMLGTLLDCDLIFLGLFKCYEYWQDIYRTMDCQNQRVRRTCPCFEKPFKIVLIMMLKLQRNLSSPNPRRAQMMTSLRWRNFQV